MHRLKPKLRSLTRTWHHRPGAAEVAVHEELDRVVPVIAAIRAAGCTVPISVDTRSAAVAQAALDAGATLVNDVSAGAHDPRMLPLVAARGVPFIAMHMRGTPATMTQLTQYTDVVSEVITELGVRMAAAQHAGIPRWLQIVDPGVGFAKTADQSLVLMAELQRIKSELRCPLLIGPSRKRFIAAAGGEQKPQQASIGNSDSNSDLHARDMGTVGAVCSAAERGASIVRVHNVAAAKPALAVVQAIRTSRLSLLRTDT